MIIKIDHIGIAVRDINDTLVDYERIFNLKPFRVETLEYISTRIAFLRVGETLVELLEPSSQGLGRIGAFLEENGEGFHHIAFRVDNIDRELERLTSAGVGLRDKEPREGGDNSRIAFLEPEFTQNVLTELVERTRELEE